MAKNLKVTVQFVLPEGMNENDLDILLKDAVYEFQKNREEKNPTDDRLKRAAWAQALHCQHEIYGVEVVYDVINEEITAAIAFLQKEYSLDNADYRGCHPGTVAACWEVLSRAALIYPENKELRDIWKMLKQAE